MPWSSLLTLAVPMRQALTPTASTSHWSCEPLKSVSISSGENARRPRIASFSMHAMAGVLWSFYGAMIGATVLAIEAALVAVLNVIVVVHILEQKQAYSRRPTSSPSSDDSLPVL